MSHALVLPSPPATPPAPLNVRKRDGSVVAFDAGRIRAAMAKAFHAEHWIAIGEALPATIAATLAELASQVVAWCEGRTELQVERIQDEVERTLMTAGEHRIARRYVLYRERRAAQRRNRTILVRRADGTETHLDASRLLRRIEAACAGLPATVAAAPVF